MTVTMPMAALTLQARRALYAYPAPVGAAYDYDVTPHHVKNVTRFNGMPQPDNKEWDRLPPVSEGDTRAVDAYLCALSDIVDDIATQCDAVTQAVPRQQARAPKKQPGDMLMDVLKEMFGDKVLDLPTRPAATQDEKELAEILGLDPGSVILMGCQDPGCQACAPVAKPKAQTSEPQSGDRVVRPERRTDPVTRLIHKEVQNIINTASRGRAVTEWIQQHGSEQLRMWLQHEYNWGKGMVEELGGQIATILHFTFDNWTLVSTADFQDMGVTTATDQLCPQIELIKAVDGIDEDKLSGALAEIGVDFHSFEIANINWRYKDQLGVHYNLNCCRLRFEVCGAPVTIFLVPAGLLHPVSEEMTSAIDEAKEAALSATHELAS